MVKKIFGYFMIIFLFGGSICGIVYGLKFQNCNDSIEYANSTQILTVIEGYKKIIADDKILIKSINDQLALLQKANESATDSITELNSNIAQLNEQKIALEAEIKQLQSLLDAYAEYTNETYTVTFFVNGVIYETKAVNKQNNNFPVVSEPALANKLFIGWEFEGLTIDTETYKVNSNISVNAVFTDLTFATANWANINDICMQGKATNYFNIGDEKSVTLTTGEEITVVILDFYHDQLTSSSDRATLTLGLKDCLNQEYKMNLTGTNVGSWENSEMRISLLNIYETLPADLKLIIKNVNKKTTAGNKSTSISTTSDKLFLFSDVEVTGTTNKGYVDEGFQYSYFKDLSSRKKNVNGVNSFWWLRSPNLVTSETFEIVGREGEMSMALSSDAYGLSFGFCI